MKFARSLGMLCANKLNCVIYNKMQVITILITFCLLAIPNCRILLILFITIDRPNLQADRSRIKKGSIQFQLSLNCQEVDYTVSNCSK